MMNKKVHKLSFCYTYRLRILLIFCTLFSLPLKAIDFTYSGYLKSYALAQDEIKLSDTPIELEQQLDSNFQSQNAARFMISGFSESSGNLEMHYEIQPIYKSTPINTNNTGAINSTISSGSTIYRYKDLDVELTTHGDQVVVLQNLDRMNYQYSNQTGDLTLGRQVISFGSARFINPTDIFIPFNIQTLNQEYRVGIDALRYQASLGDFSVIDMGVIIGEDAKTENSAAFIRAKSSITGNDLEVMIIQLKDVSILGGGLEKSIGEFGFWFETAYADLNELSVDDYIRTSIGSDYAVNESTIISLEYHYNGAGSNNSEDYISLLNTTPYKKLGIYLLGKQYLIPALIWTATPLITVNASGFFNLSDQSIFLNLSSEVSWSDNLYSDFGIYLSSGDGLINQPSPQQVALGSEFGSYPLSLYASLKYYF